MIVIAISFIVLLFGLGMYLVSEKAKAQEIGKIMLFCGLLAFLLLMPAHPLGLLPR